MKKLLNYLLLFSFVVTNLVPITGLAIHKGASVLFLILCLIHTVVYRKKMNKKRYLVLFLVVISFVSGIWGMIYYHIPIIIALHKVISIGIVFFLAIHIFVFHRRMKH